MNKEIKAIQEERNTYLGLAAITLMLSFMSMAIGSCHGLAQKFAPSMDRNDTVMFELSRAFAGSTGIRAKTFLVMKADPEIASAYDELTKKFPPNHLIGISRERLASYGITDFMLVPSLKKAYVFHYWDSREERMTAGSYRFREWPELPKFNPNAKMRITPAVVAIDWVPFGPNAPPDNMDRLFRMGEALKAIPLWQAYKGYGDVDIDFLRAFREQDQRDANSVWFTRIVVSLVVLPMLIYLLKGMAYMLRQSHSGFLGIRLAPWGMAYLPTMWQAMAPDLWDFLITRDLEVLHRTALVRMQTRYSDLNLREKATQLASHRIAGRIIADHDGRFESLVAIWESLHALAGVNEDQEAKAMFNRAIRSGKRSEKRRLLVQAIRRQKEMSLLVANKPGQPKTTDRTSSPEATQSRVISLGVEIERRFPLPNYLPVGIDTVMVRTIGIVLLELGSGKNVFGANYRPEDSLKRDVYRKYRSLSMRFNPGTYKAALQWMVANGALKSKQKTDVWTYGLSTKANANAHEAAHKLVLTFKRVKLSFQRVH